MRHWLGFALGLLIGQWLAFGDVDSPARLHEQGMVAYERHDYPAAARLWSHAAAVHPDNPLFHYLRGTALARLGQRHAAVDAYQLSLLLEPSEEIARLAREGLATLREPAAAGPAETEVPLEPVRGVWVASVVVNSAHRGRFMVDTGSSVTIVSPALAAAAGIPERADDVIELQTVAGRTAGAAARVASLRVGSAEVRDAHVVVHDPGPGVDGILGNSFLAHYRITLDADQRLLRLHQLTRD